MNRTGRTGTCVPALLLAIVATLSAPAARGQPATLPFPLEVVADEGVDGLLLQLDPAAVHDLSRLDSVVLVGAPLPDAAPIDLVLERLRLPREGWPVHVDGQPTDLQPDEGLSLWSGHPADAPDDRVYLAVSTHGTRGWIRRDGALLHWLAGPHAELGWSSSITRLVSEARLLDLGADRGKACQPTLPAGPTTTTLGPVTPGVSQAPAGVAAPVTLACRIALEVDTQLYAKFGDVLAALTYVTSLWGAVDEVYRRDLDAVVVMPYLNLNTISDPWQSPDQGGNSIDMLFEFQDAWAGGAAPVSADLFHFLSGASLGGGVAYLSALCHPDWSFAVSGNLAGLTPFPVVQGPLNWDFVVTAHETGHSFGAPHTHDLCPPVDECAPPGYFGQCQTQQVCVEGTIMSYCHQCTGGLDNMRAEFHAANVANIREFVDTWSCLQPFRGLYADDLGDALPGPIGKPVAVPTFVPPDGVDLTFKLAPATSSGMGLLVGGLTTLNAPLQGGVLVPSVDSLVALAVPGPSFTRSFTLGIPTPDDGMLVFLQTWFPDATGAAATNASRVELHWPDPWAPTPWYTHANGRRYALSAPGSWAQCEAEAQSWGGHLAMVDNQGLNDWLVQRFSGQTASGAAFLGLTDQAGEGTWEWISGDPVTYTNWDSGQPDDDELSGEDHAALLFGSGTWADVLGSGYGVNRGIMERP